MKHLIKTITPVDNYEIIIQFKEGIIKKINIKTLLKTEDEKLINKVHLDNNGTKIIFNNKLQFDSDELFKKAKKLESPFENLLSFKDATDIWQLNESTLRKAVTYGKLIDGIDVVKFGKQWVITKDAMIREYGDPKKVNKN